MERCDEGCDMCTGVVEVSWSRVKKKVNQEGYADFSGVESREKSSRLRKGGGKRSS